MNFEIVFESERILFVRLSEKLINDYLNMVNDKEIRKLISHDIRTYTFLDESEWVKSKINEKANVFSMIEKETNDFIGNIEIMNIKDNIGELGISITSKKQGNHYGQEAIKKMIDYSFNELKLDGLDLYVFDFNERAIKCYQKVGFKKVGVGRTEDEIYMVLKKEKN